MIGNQPVITAGTIAGLILAAWKVLVDQGILSGLTPEAQDSLSVFVNLLVPIIAAIIAARFVTPVAKPEGIAAGTIINANSPEPTVTVPQA